MKVPGAKCTHPSASQSPGVSRVPPWYTVLSRACKKAGQLRIIPPTKMVPSWLSWALPFSFSAWLSLKSIGKVLMKCTSGSAPYHLLVSPAPVQDKTQCSAAHFRPAFCFSYFYSLSKLAQSSLMQIRDSISLCTLKLFLCLHQLTCSNILFLLGWIFIVYCRLLKLIHACTDCVHKLCCCLLMCRLLLGDLYFRWGKTR